MSPTVPVTEAIPEKVRAGGEASRGIDARDPVAIRKMLSGPGAISVVVKISEQRLRVYKGSDCALTVPVSTGVEVSTPRGSFRVTNKERSPAFNLRGEHVRGGAPNNPLGSAWLGLNANHWKTGVPIGLHGTNEQWLIGMPVSRGCVRLRNDDALLLFKLLPVGTQVTIVD